MTPAAPGEAVGVAHGPPGSLGGQDLAVLYAWRMRDERPRGAASWRGPPQRRPQTERRGTLLHKCAVAQGGSGESPRFAATRCGSVTLSGRGAATTNVPTATDPVMVAHVCSSLRARHPSHARSGGSPMPAFRRLVSLVLAVAVVMTLAIPALHAEPVEIGRAHV